MALRFRAQFTSERGQTWTIQIFDEDHSGSVTTLQVAPPGFSLTWAGGEDIFHPVIPSTCTVPVYIQDAAQATFVEDMATANEGRFRMCIRKGDGDTATLWWVGLITVDNIVQSDQAFPQALEIQAVDGLQLLSRVDYDNTDGAASVADVLLYCLKQIGTDDLFTTDGADVPMLRVLADLEPDVATYDDPFDEVKLVPGYWNVVTQEYDYDLNSEEVLTQVARAYNSRLMLCEGAFQFHSVSKPLNAISNYFTTPYTADGTTGTASGTTFVATVGSTANIVPLSGFERRVIAPVSKVRRPLVYGEGILIDNIANGGVALVPSGGTGTGQATYTLSSDNVFPSGTTFQITGTCSVNADYLGGSTGLHQCARLRLGIKLRVGTYYLDRELDIDTENDLTVDADEFNVATSDETVFLWAEPNTLTWNTSSADRVHYGSDVLNYDKKLPDFVTGQDDSTSFTLDLTTPGLPAQQDVDVELQVVGVLYNSNTGAANQAKLDATTIDVTLSLATGDGLNGSSVIYEASNDNDATEVREESAAVFGSQLVFSNVYLYNPAEFYNVNGGLPDWVADGYTTAKELHELCVTQQAAYFNDPREIQQGSLFSVNGTTLPFYSYVYHADRLTWYMVVNMTMHADAETYDVELHELSDSSSNPAPVSTIVKPKPGKPIPTAVALDSLQKRVSRETRSSAKQIAVVQSDLSSIQRTTDSSGGLSTIQLQYLGDVKISGPTDGQILEYNAAAQRWANVTATGGGASALDDLDDVDVGSATDGQVMKYNATDQEWQAADDNDTDAFADLSDVNPLLSPTAGDLLIWTSVNGGQWSSTTPSLAVGGQIDMGDLGNVSEGTGTSGNILVDYNLSGAYWVTSTPATWAGVHLPLGHLANVSVSSPSTGDLLQFNGSQWVPHTPFSYITVTSSYYSADGNADYIPVGGTLSETTSSNYYTIWSAPAAGEVVKATVMAQTSTAGSTVMRIRKYPTPSWIDTDTQTLAGGYAVSTFTFDTATFNAGDRLQFQIDPTGRPNGVQVTILIKLNH